MIILVPGSRFQADRQVVTMNKLRILSVVLLGVSMAGVSGMSVARTPPSGSGGGYSKPAPSGGSGGGYSKPGTRGGSGGYSKPGGDYHRPYGGDYHRPYGGDYHRPHGDYYRHYGGHYKPYWHDWDDDWSFSLFWNPFYYSPWYYPSPYYYPGPYYYPPYYYPSGVGPYPTEPPEYVQREEYYGPAESSASWYYCTDPQGYYPYVEQCNVGWIPVAPRPSEAPAEGR